MLEVVEGKVKERRGGEEKKIIKKIIIKKVNSLTEPDVRVDHVAPLVLVGPAHRADQEAGDDGLVLGEGLCLEEVAELRVDEEPS